jgi:hypothetical protein
MKIKGLKRKMSTNLDIRNPIVWCQSMRVQVVRTHTVVTGFIRYSSVNFKFLHSLSVPQHVSIPARPSAGCLGKSAHSGTRKYLTGCNFYTNDFTRNEAHSVRTRLSLEHKKEREMPV